MFICSLLDLLVNEECSDGLRGFVEHLFFAGNLGRDLLEHLS